MKNILLLSFMMIISCNSNRTVYKLDDKNPIVDYPQSYEYYNHSRGLNEAITKHNEQTLILFNRKAISYKKFENLINKQKIKSIVNILDSNKIKNLGYSYHDIKRIISTSDQEN